MRQLYLPKQVPAHIISLENNNFHYIINVLRLGVGDHFPVIFRTGEVFRMVITEVSSTTCNLQLAEKLPLPPKGPELFLIQALPKGKKFDHIIRQATECGVSTIIPLVTEFSQVRTSKQEHQKKMERWKRIIKEAIQQSGTTILTDILPPVPIQKIPTAKEPNCLGLLFHQEILEFNSLHRYLSTYPKKVYISIGAEGGFSSQEIELFQNRGFHTVNLGETILRTETATVFALGAVKTILQESNVWVQKN